MAALCAGSERGSTGLDLGRAKSTRAAGQERRACVSPQWFVDVLGPLDF